jgi:hypothetical protein
VSYASQVASLAPTHWWRCADPGGRAAHDIGSAEPVTLGADSDGGFPYTGIAQDGGAYFAAFSRLRSPGSGVHLLATHWSIEAWCFLTSSKNAGGNEVVFDLIDDATGTAIRLFAQTTAQYGTAGTFFANQLEAVTNWSHWKHIVYVFTGAQRISYVDGVAIATVPSGAFGAADYRIALGGSSAGTELCTGGVCEAAVYDQALSAANVAANYAARENSLTASPIWKGGGLYPTSSGGRTPTSDLEDAILSSVRSTYRNAP